MIRGLPASIIAHAAVIGASYVTFPYWGTSTRVLATELEAVDVNFAEIGEITNIAPLIETEPEEPEDAAPEAPEVPEPVPEDPVEEDLPEAEQDVADVEAAPPEENPEDLLPKFEPEQQEEEDEPEPEPEKKPDPAPRRPNDDLMDFLNQSDSTFKSERATREKRPEPKPVTPEPETALENAPKPAETRTRRGAGERTANTARIESILYSKIVPCWDNVVDLPFPERLNVRLSVKLNRDGSLADVDFIEPARPPIGNSPMRTAMERAKRAVQKCAPYNLPDDDYDLWSEGAVNLGPAFDAKTQR
jgi:hypothetical protein